MFFKAVTILFAAALANSSLAHFRDGEKLLQNRNFQAAALEFNQALTGDNEPTWIRVWSLINLGRVFDATGQRDRALRQYQLALDTKDDTFNALTFATRYLFDPPSPDKVWTLPGPVDDRTSPTVLSRIEPEYPAEALLGRFEGSVAVEASVAVDGELTNLHVMTPLGLGVDEAALASVRQWKFAPGTLDKQPLAMNTRVTVEFHLPSQPQGWRVTKMQCQARLLRADAFAPGKMSPELEEEAKIAAAVSRTPTATLSMEINQQGVPQNIQAVTSSLPVWGEDAVNTIRQWRFTPSPTTVPCTAVLARVM